MSTEPNPYAAPAAADPSPPAHGNPTVPADAELIRRALADLDLHLSSAEGPAEDARLAGPRFRRSTRICAALGVLGVFVLVSSALVHAGTPQLTLLISGSVLLVLGLIGGLVLGAQDRSLPTPAETTDPAKALRVWLMAMRLGRAGRLRAMLSPTAREADTDVPDLSPVITAGGTYAMATLPGILAWCRSFAAAGMGQVRWTTVRRITMVQRQDDVAVLTAEVAFQSWPQWANVLSLVLFVLVRVVGIIVAVVLYFSLRRRQTVTITKTLIRGRDERWYLLDPDFTPE